MANVLFRIISSELIATKSQQIRYGHRVRGKPPGIARTLEQRLAELKPYNPALQFKVDIGLPAVQKSKRAILAQQLEHRKKIQSDPNLERLARHKELRIDLDETEKIWQETSGAYDCRKIAEHYNIFQDLYGDAYFTPRVPLNISYTINDDGDLAKAFRGNILKPLETSKPPEVAYESDPNTLWTLLLTCPDGNLVEENSEYCHWFIGNIPGSDVEKGEMLMDYLKPIPLGGTGYHRYIFILYKQDKKLDFSAFRKEQPCLDLKERNWNTYNFYKDHQDFLTPAGLSFFQADWDSSVKDFFHNTLGTEEPTFEYNFPQPHIAKQRWFPLRMPFNLYMDKYRDPKQIHKEYLLKKLKKTHPFKEPEAPLRYPNAQYIDRSVPSWLKLEIRKERLGWGRINDV
ncbi:39S ribosomal protein L38, mitochondrial [Diprion similis]|uniref:39S ribosomal protein L38, mitochondrial n=1 Tax=Diprion similis TaxID=362088 RepID=UPI001EF93745|nr:39S ribosomal protein L38, mitochondrial [Diprion similis]